MSQIKTNSLTLNINVVSAKDLTEIDQIAPKAKLYVAVSLTGAAQTEQKAQTHVDKDGGRNPTWNFPVKFAVDVDGVKQDLETRVVFSVKCENNGKALGEVHVSIVDLMQVSGGNFVQYVAVSYPIKKGAERTVGMLNFEFKFGNFPTSEKPAAASATRNVEGYPPQIGHYYPPPPPTAAGYGGYPPSPYPYSPYPPQYPPHHGGYHAAAPYGYPAHASHVQAPPPPAKQRSITKKSKSNSGKWVTKALGAVGTLAIGAITGGSVSVSDLSGLTSGFQMPDSSAFAPTGFSSLYQLPDPSSTQPDFSSFYQLSSPSALPDFYNFYPPPNPSTLPGNSYC